MKNDIEKIKKLYEELHNITVKISSLIETDDLERIKEILNKRDFLINEINKLVHNMEFSDYEKSILNNIIDKTKLIENENITRLEAKQAEIGKKISNINHGQRALSAYKLNGQARPIIFDHRE